MATMETQNPFLVDDSQTQNPFASGVAVSNPFLSDGIPASNPFGSLINPFTGETAPSNPFADIFGGEPVPIQENMYVHVSDAQTGLLGYESQYTNATACEQSVFGTEDAFLNPIITFPGSNDDLLTEVVFREPPKVEMASPHTSPKRRPPPRPPSRPSRPPSRPQSRQQPHPHNDTQQLILSLTGALDATSDHLDRLGAIAPSPTPGSRSHTPSPSPSPTLELMHEKGPARPPPPRPPSRPPSRPAERPGEGRFPGSQPPEAKNIFKSEGEKQPAEIESSSEPPVDEIDLFNNTAPVARTKADILSLFNKKTEVVTDLLSDDLPNEDTVPNFRNIFGPQSNYSQNLFGAVEECAVQPIGAAGEEYAATEVSSFGNIFGGSSNYSHSIYDTNGTIGAPGTAEASSFGNIFGVAQNSNQNFYGADDAEILVPPNTAVHGTFGNELFGLGDSDNAQNGFGASSNNTTSAMEFTTGESYGAELFGAVGPAPSDTGNFFAADLFGAPCEVLENEPQGLFGCPPGSSPHQEGTDLKNSKVMYTALDHVEAPAEGAYPPPSPLNIFDNESAVPEHSELFGTSGADLFGSAPQTFISEERSYLATPDALSESQNVSARSSPYMPDDDFDAFANRFETVTQVDGDPFAAFGTVDSAGDDAWGNAIKAASADQNSECGFGATPGFDEFLSMTAPPAPPRGTPSHNLSKQGSEEERTGVNLVIRPQADVGPFGPAPALAPPPKPVSFIPEPMPVSTNPFLDPLFAAKGPDPHLGFVAAHMGAYKRPERTDSQETPPTPLFDDDVSQPLEDFPRTIYDGRMWEMQLRQPAKKKITSQRFWKKVFVKLGVLNNVPVILLYNNKEDTETFQELPLQPCYSVSEISAQQFDQFGKIFTVKVQYVFYKERPGVRPGQVTKAERLTSRLQQFAVSAIAGDYAGVKEFGSDLKKLGIPVEHAPQISELLKLGCHSYEDLKQFSYAVDELLFKIPSIRDRALNYKTEEVQMTAVDEFFVEQDKVGRILRQVARVRVFVLAFLSGMPDVELGVNDLPRQGLEVVGRHDIIPVVTEEWIRLEDIEFHTCVNKPDFDETRTIKFRPPDACYIELFRFRIRPPRNRELPLQIRSQIVTTGTKIEIRSDILIPGFISRKYGQIPCEDISIRFPIPEGWIYMFRVEKHFKYGSVKASHRRAGKIKGIERFLGAVETLEQTPLEVSSGTAKYEHHNRAIVWRIPKLPKEGQGSYTTHTFVCRINLTAFDQMPEQLPTHCHVEFTMPATNVSHVTLRSLSVTNPDPPEKYVRYLSRHEYDVEIEHTHGQGPNAYIAATQVEKPVETPPPPKEAESDSDSD